MYDSEQMKKCVICHDICPLGSRETTPFTPLHTWINGCYCQKQRMTLPPVRAHSVYHPHVKAKPLRVLRFVAQP